jgi:hypothetical protein
MEEGESIRRTMKDPAIVASLLLMMGCKVSGSVQCQEDEHCDLETGGACLRNPDTKRCWCSYPAADCPEG